jgi:peptidoglycan/LPS O-acetylase OafA/YrhL
MTGEVVGEWNLGARSHAYVPGIDGLRAIAVLSVLIYHIRPTLLPGGFVGVDFFFVISGFVVSLATSTIAAPTAWQLLLAFYRRRVIRILPASLLLLLATTLITVLFIPLTGRITSTDMTGVAAVFGAANLALWWTAGDYFSTGAELNPFTHMWSLGVEEQFYVIFPIFAVGLWLSNRRRLRYATTLGLGILCLLSILIAARATSYAQAFAFYMLPARFWELGVGVLLFQAIESRRVSSAPPWIPLISVVAVLLLLYSLVAVGSTDFPFPGALAPVFAAVVLIYVSTVAPRMAVARVLALPSLRYVGRISYSLYLWHWPVIVLMRWTVGLDAAVLQIGALLVSWLFADLSYRYVERPMRNSPFLSRRSDAQVVLIGVGALAVAGAFVVGMIVARPHLSMSVTRDADVWMANKLPEGGACGVTRDKDAMPHGGTRFVFRRTGCPTVLEGRLYVIGDSHAWAYLRMLGRVALESGRVVSVMTAPGCSVLPGYRNPGVDERCALFLSAAFAALPRDLGRGDVIFMPGLRTPRYREYSDATFGPAPAARVYTDAQLAVEVARLTPLLDREVRLIIEAPKPVFRYAPLRCSDWFNWRNPHCLVAPMTRQEALERRASVMLTLQRLRTDEPRIELWDPFPALCPTLACAPMRGGKPLVSDGDHLTGYANDLLYGDFAGLISGRGKSDW